MRRADRLFQIVQLLVRHRRLTARALADRLEVSERTIYRDIADLALCGVPVVGETGVGYRLLDYELPPLMFERTEVEAVVLGLRIVESWGDPELSRNAATALAKVEAALPGSRRGMVRETRLFAPTHSGRPAVGIDLAVVRRALRESRKLRFDYRDGQDRSTRRTVRPLGLAFFGPVWVLTAWCELRDDFRSFRPDRIVRLDLLDERFEPEPGKTIEDFLRRMSAEE